MTQIICRVPDDDPLVVESRLEEDGYQLAEGEWVLGTEPSL